MIQRTCTTRLAPKKICAEVISLKYFTLTILTVAVLSISACTTPKNVAVSNRPLALASVHRAEVVAIYPVFIPNGVTIERGSAAAYSLGEFVGDVVFENSLRRYQLSMLSGNIAEAASGAYEERYNGGFCQYFITTTDPQLIKLSKDNQDDEKLLIDLLRNEVDTLSYEAQSLMSAFQNAMFELEISAESLNDFILDTEQKTNSEIFETLKIELEQRVRISTEQVTTIESLLEKNQSRLSVIQRRLASPLVSDETMLSINNPCREIDIGQKVLVSAVPNASEFALQPVF